jgi:hypothetical protein
MISNVTALTNGLHVNESKLGINLLKVFENALCLWIVPKVMQKTEQWSKVEFGIGWDSSNDRDVCRVGCSSHALV